MLQGYCYDYGPVLLLGDRPPNFRGKQMIEQCEPRGKTYGVTKADLSKLDNDIRFDSLRLVLIAANRAVAHIEPSDVDHAVTDFVLIAATDLVEELVRTHIYVPNKLSLEDAMKFPSNCM